MGDLQRGVGATCPPLLVGTLRAWARSNAWRLDRPWSCKEVRSTFAYWQGGADTRCGVSCGLRFNNLRNSPGRRFRMAVGWAWGLSGQPLASLRATWEF